LTDPRGGIGEEGKWLKRKKGKAPTTFPFHAAVTDLFFSPLRVRLSDSDGPYPV